MITKYKLSDLAKDLKMTANEIIELLAAEFGAKKTAFFEKNSANFLPLSGSEFGVICLDVRQNKNTVIGAAQARRIFQGHEKIIILFSWSAFPLF